jgi:hypothetical protein
MKGADPRFAIMGMVLERPACAVNGDLLALDAPHDWRF